GSVLIVSLPDFGVLAARPAVTFRVNDVLSWRRRRSSSAPVWLSLILGFRCWPPCSETCAVAITICFAGRWRRLGAAAAATVIVASISHVSSSGQPTDTGSVRVYVVPLLPATAWVLVWWTDARALCLPPAPAPPPPLPLPPPPAPVPSPLPGA